MKEARLRLYRPPEGARPDLLDCELSAWEEGHLARAAHEYPGPLDRGDDALPGGDVDPERLLGEEVFAGRGGVQVESLVQVMRDRDVDDVDLLGGEQLPVVGRQEGGRVDALEPGEALRIRIADARQDGPHGVVL